MTNDTMTKECPNPNDQSTMKDVVRPAPCRDWSLRHWSFVSHWSFVLAVILFMSGCSKHSAPAPDLLAKVGSAEIRLADFNHEVERRAKANQPVVSVQALLDEMIGRE